jgi:predicted metal-dependent phosphotriesterase family hydrolase
LGDIDPTTLGPTLIHEHLATSPPPYATQEDPDLGFGDRCGASAELTAFRDAGGGAVCELTTTDYGRDIGISVAASRESGVNVVQATGLQKGIYYPAGTSRREIDEVAHQFVADIIVGTDGTEFKSGVIKVGTCSTDEIWDVEKRIFAAAARAAMITGAPILTHTQAGRLGHEQLDIFEAEGLPLDQVCVGHLDRNIGWKYLAELASRGAWLGLDQWTKDKYGLDVGRAEMVQRLVDAGHTRVNVSGDLGRGSYQRAYGGLPGLDGCFTAIKNALSEDTRKLVLITNPALFLTFREAVK